MGSSPVTATTHPDSVEDPGRVLSRFLHQTVGWRTGVPLVVAFSGGPDSTALLAATMAVADAPDRVYAAHYDHQLDADSSRRARAARRLAADLGAVWISEQATQRGRMRFGVEDWARRQRYAFLERTRQRVGATAILTAHHLEDQVETVLLRMLMGTGIRGLAGIRPRVRNIGRPWLDVPSARLPGLLQNSRLEAVLDPTNQDLSRPRNLVRHKLLPLLRRQEPDIDLQVVRLARLADRVNARCTRLLSEHLDANRPDGGVASVDADRFRRLPRPLWSFALSLLVPTTRQLGESSSPTRGEIEELERQLLAGAGVGVSLAGGSRWDISQGRLERRAPVTVREAHDWCLELALPGGVDLPIGGRIEILETSRRPWMLAGHPLRTGIELEPGARLQVRTRRPGDRIRPLGCDYERKLKDVLIDNRVPAAQRDRLPLLLAEDRLVWVPGVTIDHRCRIQGKSRLWLAEWHPSR